MAVLFLVITTIVLVVIKWAVTMGTVWAVCQCFGISFSMAIATIVWLVFLAVVNIFKNNIGDE